MQINQIKSDIQSGVEEFDRLKKAVATFNLKAQENQALD